MRKNNNIKKRARKISPPVNNSENTNKFPQILWCRFRPFWADPADLNLILFRSWSDFFSTLKIILKYLIHQCYFAEFVNLFSFFFPRKHFGVSYARTKIDHLPLSLLPFSCREDVDAALESTRSWPPPGSPWTRPSPPPACWPAFAATMTTSSQSSGIPGRGLRLPLHRAQGSQV